MYSFSRSHDGAIWSAHTQYQGFVLELEFFWVSSLVVEEGAVIPLVDPLASALPRRLTLFRLPTSPWEYAEAGAGPDGGGGAKSSSATIIGNPFQSQAGYELQNCCKRQVHPIGITDRRGS